MLRFIHAADIHLDSPLRGLARYQGAPLEELQGATREALKNLVSKALALSVDFVLIAGDLYDGDWPDYNTGLFYLQQMARLQQAGIRVVTISGNHDAQSKITRNLRLPDNVTACSVIEPETVLFEDLKVAVHGQGFAKAVVTEDLSLNYPAPVSGYFNIGLLHTSADGRPGHDTYAPCSVEALAKMGYAYWALGHIHKREVLHQSPWIVFSGNLQGRHAKETGPKGATLVTVVEGEIQSVEELVLDVVRWVHLKVDITELKTRSDFFDRVTELLDEARTEAGQRLIAFRLEIVGRGVLHSAIASDLEYWTNNLRALPTSLHERAWFEKLRLKSRQAVRSDSEQDVDTLHEFLSELRSQTSNEDQLKRMGKDLFAPLLKKLPRAWREGEEGFDPTDGGYLTDATEDALGLLEERLLGSGGESS